MNEQSAKSSGKRIILRRIELSLWFGVIITLVLGMTLNFLPFQIGKFLFWPALPFVKVYDEELGAPFYYMIGLPLAIPAYSLISFLYLTVRGLSHPQENEREP